MSVIFLENAFQTASVNEVEGLIQRHNDLCAKSRKDPLNVDLRQAFKRVSTQLGNCLPLIEVSADDQDVLMQLAGHDHVHSYGADSVEEILRYRAGKRGESKQTFALVKPGQNGKDRQVLAAIYGHMDFVPDSNGKIHCSNLKGNVHDILTAEIHGVEQPNLATFYSVTAFEKRGVKGVAGLLINRLHAHLRQEMPSIKMISTLSPARGFGKWAKHSFLGELRAFSEVDLQRHILSYVPDFDAHSVAPDYARNLHIKDNGATLGWIHSKANVQGSRDDVYGDGHIVPMVNYLYDLDGDTLERQRIQNLSGNVGVHQDLIEHLRMAT